MRRGFTLLEVVVAVALLSIVTGAAMAAYIAQSRIINTQQQTSSANDHAREAIRLISNDARAVGAGLNIITAGFPGCAPGTIPFDTNGTAAGVACLPPVFRSTSPLYYDDGKNPAKPAAAGSAWPANYTQCVAGAAGLYNPGYRLTLGSGAFAPSAANLFCPDDLVVLAVDDTEPLFMVSPAPTFPSGLNTKTLAFAGSTTPAGYGFDDQFPNLPAAPTTATSPMMLFGGATTATLMNVTQGVLGVPNYAGGTCTEANCGLNAIALVPWTRGVDLFGGSGLSFGSVALPARLQQYHIQPVNAQGLNVPPFVSANLVRTTIVPAAIPLGGGYPFTVASTQILIEGVVDMQVEFGFDPTGNGLLRYVSSGGTQSITDPGLPPYNPDPSQQLNNCLGGVAQAGVFPGVCFPTGGILGLAAIQQLRTIRIALTVRSSTIANSATNLTGAQSSAGMGGDFFLRPAVTDICPPGANIEAANWGFACPATIPSLRTVDGANYRQVSTEVYVRNLGLGT
jgi:prepilin-type N-terminal cleavage/methylation domain-containing protein